MATKLAPKTISQHKMRLFLELKKKAAEFDQLKKEFKALYAAGVRSQPGKYACSVEQKPWTQIPWRDEYMIATSQFATEQIEKKYKGKAVREFIIVIDKEA